jgi:hypothetical protein
MYSRLGLMAYGMANDYTDMRIGTLLYISYFDFFSIESFD